MKALCVESVPRRLGPLTKLSAVGLVALLCLAAGTARADRSYVPLEWTVEGSPVIVMGKLEKIDSGPARSNDTGTLRIAAVLKNLPADPVVKAGGTLKVAIPSSTSRNSESVMYKVGDEGVWILSREGGTLVPMRLEPPAQQVVIAGWITQQAAEQTANVERVTRELAERERGITVPVYTSERFASDLKRGPDATADVESLRPVYVEDSKGDMHTWVYVDRQGKIGLATPYHPAGGFNDGLAAVGTTVDKTSTIHDYGYIDPTGNLVIPAEYDACEAFHDGLGVVSKGGRFGLVNRTGKMVLPPIYKLIWYHTADVALVQMGDTKQLIDLSGKVLFTAGERDVVGTYSDGLLQVNLPAGSIASALASPHDYSGRWIGFVDLNGRFAVDSSPSANGGMLLTTQREFHGGFVAGESHNRWGFIAADGTLAIPLKFQAVGDFSKGLAPAMLSQEDRLRCWGYIDEKGAFAIPPAFESASTFSDGLAAVRMPTWVMNPQIPGAIMHTTRWGFIDKTGKVVIAPQFQSAASFQHGIAFVDEVTRYGLIDATGKYVWWAQRRSPVAR